MQVASIKTLPHTDEVTFVDGSVANTFEASIRVNGVEFAVVTFHRLSAFTDFVENRRQAYGEAFVQTDASILDDNESGLVFQFSFDPVLEETFATAAAESEQRRSEFNKRIQARLAERLADEAQ